MLKQRNIWMMVLMLFILTAYSHPLHVTTKQIKYTNELMEVDLNIPIVSGSINQSFQRQVNRLLRKESLDLKREVEKQARENMAISKKEGFPYRLHAAVSNYEVTYNQHGILSIPVTLYSYTGGAHGMTVKVPNNFDFHTGKSLQLSDLFKKGTNYKQVITNEVIAQIKKENDLYFDNAIDVVKKMPNDQPYYITSDGIVVYYGLYEIAPYAAGIREFLIPFSILQPYMKIKLAR